MEDKDIKKVIESILFTWGDPLELNEISKIVNIKRKKCEELLEEMIEEFNSERGLRIVKMENEYQIGTKPEYFEYIKELNKEKPQRSLSNAALETLSIIAYKQPIIKAEIEYIRGVKCDKALQTLMEKELVDEIGRLERPGRPIIYGTTNEFLKLFSIESLEQLPEIENIRQDLLKYEQIYEMDDEE